MERNAIQVRMVKHSNIQTTLTDLMVPTNLDYSFRHTVPFTREVQDKLVSCKRTFIQIRFCKYDVSAQQRDSHPPGLILKLNDNTISLPENIIPVVLKTYKSAEFKDITISGTWNPEPDSPRHKYALSVQLVQMREGLTQQLLLKEMKWQPSIETKKMIEKAHVQPDDDLQILTPMDFDAICPYLKTKMKYPCRGLYCNHLQCFDAKAFFRFQKKDSFNAVRCPFCDTSIHFDDLRIDKYFQNIITAMPQDATNKVILLPDGTHRYQASS